MTDSAFVQQEPFACPNGCDSDISGDHVEIAYNQAYQRVTCHECEAAWTDVYLLSFRINISGAK